MKVKENKQLVFNKGFISVQPISEEVDYFLSNLPDYYETANPLILTKAFTQGYEIRFVNNEYVGKWGKFWDNGENTVIVGKLYGYYQYQIHHFKARTHDDEVAFYTNFEPLTDEQLKVLGVKNEY